MTDSLSEMTRNSSGYSTSCWEESMTGDEYLDYLDRREAEKNGW